MDFRTIGRQNVIKSYFLMTLMVFLLVGFLDLIAYFYSTYSLLPITIFAVIFGSLSTIYSYYNSDKLVLRLTKTTLIDHDQNPQLYNLVQEVCLAAGLPLPKIGIVEDDAPNAFATGRDEDHAVIVFTTRILEIMDREELQGVVAHELAHVKNRDTLVNAVVTVTVGIIVVISDILLRTSGLASSGNNKKGSGSPIALVFLLIAAILTPIAAAMIQASISRRRESLADTSAVGFTRNPSGLRQALEKLQGDNTVVKARNKSVAHLWLEDPLPKKKLNLFSTHPTLESRIELLRRMESNPS